MPATASEIYEFGGFRLNASEYRLERANGDRVELPDKALETLCVLVRNAGHLVEKDQLLEQVWPNAFVEENNLNKCIYAIRQALGERQGRPAYIETVRKHGYRFVAEVRTAGVRNGADGLAAPTNAFQAYHLARYHFCQMTPPDLMKSREFLKQALDHDPAYAPAYSALAEQAVQEVVAGLRQPDIGYPEARAALERAFDLDPRSADYYAAAGFVALLSDWDFSGARQHLRKALDINPHHAFANSSLGQVLMFRGMSNEAGPLLRRAAELDPMNLAIQNLLPISSFLSRQYDQAIEECDRMLALYPEFIVAVWMRCWALEQTGRAEEAIVEYERAIDKPYGRLVLRWMGYAYAILGNRERALATSEQLIAESAEHYLSPTHLAVLYAALGETDKAFSYLEQGVKRRDPWMLWIGTDPRYDTLRGNPRFDDIVKRVIPADPIPVEIGELPTGQGPRLTESGAHAIVSLDDWQAISETVYASPLGVTEPPSALAQAGSGSRKGLRWVASLVVIALAATAGLVGWSIWPTGRSDQFSLQQKRLTTGGQVTRVAMGPDGRHAAVVQNAAIKLFDLENGQDRVLVPAEERIRILSIAFRPDGKAIYFGRRSVETTPVTLYSMPLDGGEPVKILDDVYGSLTFSPDQKKMAFLRRYPELNEFNILTADIDGTNISKLATSKMPDRFEGGPSWSPDGKSILCPMVSVKGGFHYGIAMIDPSTGNVTTVPNQRWTWLLYAVWLPNSKSVLLTAQGGNDVNAQLWRVDIETGDAQKVTNDSFIYETLSGSSDGRTFVASKVRQTSHIWIMGDPPLQITSGFDRYDGVDGLAWSSDGSLFYHSRASEREAIWRMRPDGSDAKEVTTDSGGGFDVSPDGRFLVFERQGPTSNGLHIMDMSTGTERPLTQNMLASTPVFSRDGSTIFFSNYDQKLSLWEIASAGGEARVVSNEFQAARFPAVSPTGRYTAFAISKAVTGEIQSAIAIRDNETKAIIKTVPIKTGLGGTYEKATIQWSADETELYLLVIDLPASRSNIAKVRIADGTFTNVTDFSDGRIFNFAVELGTGRIAVARGTVERDATLIQIDKPF